MREIYVPGIGQYDNIGDIVLRRELLRWLEPHGRLHVFVGDAPAGYAEALGLGAEHIVYRSFGAWYRAGLRHAARGEASYVFKPGEIQITVPGLKEHIGLVPLQIAVRARGGRVIRVGAGARGFGRLPRALMAPSLALTDLVLWRDARTARFLGRGGVMPDLAFAGGAPEPRGDETRDLLIVSMRGDRPRPAAAWIDAVRSFAHENGLTIRAVVQVERDDARSRLLADELGGSYDPWPGHDHHGHEQHLRELYRRSALVVSDRLHVLITAVTEGAPPAALLTDDSDKIDRHFAAAGIPSVALTDTASVDAATITHFLAEAHAGWERVSDGLRDARDRLARIRDRVGTLLDGRAPRETPRADIWHLGRRGEIPGGMTQVVNAFLRWPFERSRLRLLVTRNGRGGVSELALFLLALARLPLLGRRDRTVIVAHLSQGGSFVREGAVLRTAAALGYRTVAHLHGSAFVDFSRRSPSAVARVLRRADAVVVLSDQTRAEVGRVAPGTRAVLVPNAVPEGRAREKERLIVFGGAVTRRKGVDVLLDAWRTAQIDGWQLHIAGPIVESDLIADLPPNVHVLGALGHSALLALLERSAIAVLPSRDEAMPMFILEALARRNAVVSTRVGGIPRLLEEEAGVVLPPGDVDALAASLRSLTESASRRDGIADAGHERFEERFSAKTVYPQVEDLWLGVLSGR